MSTKIDKSYKTQSACANCRYVFEYDEYDEHIRYYCALAKPTRPKSGSLALDEVVRPIGGVRWRRALHAWDAWKEGRQVEPHGICDKYAVKKSSP